MSFQNLTCEIKFKLVLWLVVILKAVKSNSHVLALSTSVAICSSVLLSSCLFLRKVHYWGTMHSERLTATII